LLCAREPWTKEYFFVCVREKKTNSHFVLAATTSFSAKKADIWAAGVCLYCMVYGMFPFRATNQLDLFDNIREKLYASFKNKMY